MRDDVVLPVLLGSARRAYGQAIRHALTEAGFDDLPPRSAFVLGAIRRGETSASSLAQGMATSKQAASQLLDTLVARGYVDRVPDEQDRRRVTLTLTDRGRGAAVEVRDAIEGVDARLVDAVGADDLAVLRRSLTVLCELQP